jgi:hypothetical protein
VAAGRCVTVLCFATGPLFDFDVVNSPNKS